VGGADHGPFGTHLSQATNLKNVIVPTLLPGVQVNTNPTNYRPLTIAEVGGKAWVRFGDVLKA
jgi:branched-chain amino acid transport system substrate-binding protein